jgi:hypothetical protein
MSAAKRLVENNNIIPALLATVSHLGSGKEG